jgi:hypothetical protein
MIALDCLQVSEPACDQLLLVQFALVYHSENMLCQDFSCLQDHRRVMRPSLLIEVECAFDSGGRNDQLDGLGYKVLSRRPRTHLGHDVSQVIPHINKQAIF